MTLTNITCSKLIAIVVVCCCIHRVDAQSNPADTVRAVPSHILRFDSLRMPLAPIPLVGSLDRTMKSDHIITDSAVNFSDYKYVGDLLMMTPGMFIRDLGSPGQLHGMTIQGVDARGIAFTSDGILLNDPLTGIFNPYLIPTENIERIEVVNGTQAFLYGLNSTGGAINFISKSKKALHPYSRIRYSESAYDYGYVDGMVSQDIIRGLNVTTGFQHATFGGRFPNSDYDAWNARFKLRYNITNNLNVYFSEDYNQTQLGLNGGVDTSTAPALRFDRFQATMRNTDSYEKITRHDLQLGTAAKLFADSTIITTLTLYHSTNLREYHDDENRPSPNGILVLQDHWSQWYGARLSQQFSIGNQQFSFGAEAQSRGTIASQAIGQQIETATNVFGKTDVQPVELLRLSIYSRVDRYLNRSPVSYGGDASVVPLPWLEFFGGYSHSFRFPTFQELYWRDSIVSSNRSTFPPERHHLFITGIRLLSQHATLFELSFFHRTVFDAIDVASTNRSYPFPTFEFVLRNKIILQGCTTTASIHFGRFFVEGTLQYLEVTNGSGTESLLPKWSGTGGLYFWGKLVNDHLDLKTGFRGRVVSSYQGTEYNPQAIAFVPSSQPDVDAVGTSDFVLVAHLGSAYIHFIWENLLDRKYVIVPFYPMPDRAIRFGVSWEFTD